MGNLDLELEQYILNHIDKEDAVLRELERHTFLNVLRPRMLSGHLQGTLLKMFCRMLKPLNVLEVGTYTGYSSISMALGLSEGAHIHTVEINDELENGIRTFFEKAGVTEKVTLHIGDVLELLPDLPKEFDFVFIDGDKRQYPDYYHAIFPVVKPGGFILADNVLWAGKVVLPNMPDDEYTKGVMEFNEIVKNDTRVEKTILPIRDGLSLMRKKEE